jgi:hypothetical protein
MGYYCEHPQLGTTRSPQRDKAQVGGVGVEEGKELLGRTQMSIEADKFQAETGHIPPASSGPPGYSTEVL